ncbi:transcriptional regulatory protein [Plesiocystis pacifica SIR-1]|uniref:Transcriptional regulatory protein n=1 Tax=Plesiocystis pacifica SIR-1 TaxID=391625 RepID=A6GEK1_9BACT|nr:MarR family transcriptional regulator [Plesiocystis pacifica]EDM75709.1 transcriptional regulatory protein [Plesiocystis pacifica SIR-1]
MAPRRKTKADEAEVEFVAAVEAVKAQSLAQRLFKCARLLDEQAVARLPTTPGAPRIRPAHTKLYPHIDHGGTRLTELARRMGISKQAVGQLVDDLEAMGALERVPDPEDGRAKLICFSRSPGVSILDGFAVLRDFETELAEAIGAARAARLHRDLGVLLAELEAREAASTDE